jgi:ABC-type sugar transport system substrate-binding protein
MRRDMNRATFRTIALATIGALLLAIMLLAGCPEKPSASPGGGGGGAATSAGDSGGEETYKVAISSRPGQWNLDERVRGYEEYFTEETPQIEVVEVFDDETLANKGEEKASAVLSKHPDLDGFAGVNAVSGLGIAAALKNADMVGDVNVVAMDGDEGILNLIEEGVIDASVAQRQYWMSWLGVGYLYGLKHGVYTAPDGDGQDEEGEIPEVIDTTTVEVNEGNLDQFRTPSQGAKESMPEEFEEVVEHAATQEAQPDPSETYVFIGISTGAEYWRAAEAGLIDACEALGVTPDFRGPTTQDAQEQADVMATVVGMRPAGILISPGRPETLTPYINDAMEQGIPVICLDTDAPNSDRIAYFGTDNYEAGRTGAEILARLILEGEE